MPVVRSSQDMWVRGVLIASVSLALLCAPAAVSARQVSVGWTARPCRAARARRPHARIGSLNVAEVSTSDIPSLRRRPGIRWVSVTVPHNIRRNTVATRRVTASAEWQFGATRSNLVPATVERAQRRGSRSLLSTPAPISHVRSLAAKSPITYNAVTGTNTVSDATGHGKIRGGSLAAGGRRAGFAPQRLRRRRKADDRE